MENEIFTVRNMEVLRNCVEAIKGIMPSDPPAYDIIIKKHKKSKTEAQRRYFHRILSEIAKHTGNDMEDMKMDIKFRVLPLREIKCNEQVFMFPISSEKATRKQYADLISAALILADAAEVFIPSPDYWGYKI